MYVALSTRTQALASGSPLVHETGRLLGGGAPLWESKGMTASDALKVTVEKTSELRKTAAQAAPFWAAGKALPLHRLHQTVEDNI